jgi:uncharacterized protein YjbJ (UPF0337 family)
MTNMTATTPNNNKPASDADKATMMATKIKETWSKLSDDDIKLYSSNRDQFFAKLKEKHSISKEESERHLQEIEKACASGCDTEKTGNVKTA